MKKLIKSLGILLTVVASLNMSSAIAYGGDKAKAEKKAEVKAEKKAEAKAEKKAEAKAEKKDKKDDTK